MTGPGPNATIPCPSFECKRWHIAHGYGEHRCGVSVPAPTRLRRPPFKPETRRWAQVLGDEVA